MMGCIVIVIVIGLLASVNAVPVVDASNDDVMLNTTYSTKGNMIRYGSAIAVDLRDVSNLPYDSSCISTPHSTVLYRSSGYSSSELALVQKERDDYMARKNLTSLTFTLAPWGSQSDYIYGQLEEMWAYMQLAFDYMNDNERPCHVQLRC